jgi:hypothetical protein
MGDIWDTVVCGIESPAWLVCCLVDVPGKRKRNVLNLDGMSYR